jgi:hypothetical protein
MGNFLSDCFKLDIIEFGRKSVAFDQGKRKGKICFKILEVLCEALNRFGFAFLVIHARRLFDGVILVGFIFTLITNKFNLSYWNIIFLF